MELALGSINEAIVWTDTSGKIQWCNKAFDSLVEKPHIATLGQQIEELLLLHQDGLPVSGHSHPIQLLRSNPALAPTVFEYHSESTRIFLEITGNRAAISQSEEVFILTLRDVTELIANRNKLKNAKELLEVRVKERTEQLFEISERYRSILLEAVDAIITIDQDGVIESFNPAAERMFGYSAREVLGRNITLIIPSPHKENHNRYIQRYLETGEKKIIGIGRQVTGVSRDGRIIPLYLAVSEIEAGGQRFFTGILRDISQQQEAEKALKQAKDEAESANRAKSTFLANMSHEIRTPMNAVLGFSEILSTLITDKEQLHYLNSIHAAGKGLLTIINDILDLSKIEAGKLDLHYEMVDFRNLLVDIQQMFEAETSKKGLDFLVDVAPETPPQLKVDETRIRQILINLVGNALKFTPSGHIKVAVEVKKHTEESSIDLTLSVEDTGTGIESRNLETIFQAFQQQQEDAKKHFGGTGLGLTITKRLTEIMGGTVSVTSTVNKGSVFTIFLPGIKSSQQKLTAEDTEHQPEMLTISFAPASVLVVDDVTSNRELIRAMLQPTDLEVVEADSGTTALKTLHVQPPDLILLDIRMPVMDGYAVLREIKADQSLEQLPVIAITASVDLQEKSKLRRAGFDSILFKPISHQNLVSELCRFLRFSRQPDIKAVPATRKQPDGTPMASPVPQELLQTLEQEFLPEWNSFQGVLEVDRIEKFAERLSEVATTYTTPALQTYARDLALAASNFQIETIKTLLQQFPGLINSLQKGREESNR